MRRRQRWEDPGIVGERDDDGWYHYDGASLAEVPLVAAAIRVAPETLVDLADPAVPPVPRERFLGTIRFATRDGRTWDVGLDDDHLGALDDGSDDPDGDDLVTDLLRRDPTIRFALHPDREYYQVTSSGRQPVSSVVARVVEAVSGAHRALVGS